MGPFPTLGLRVLAVNATFETVSEGDSTLTSSQAASLVGVSRSRWLQLVVKYKVRSTRDARRVRRYLREDVNRVLETRRLNFDRRMRGIGAGAAQDGQLVAEVFELFQAGLPLPEIVIQTKLPTQTIRALYADYSTPLGRKVKAPPSPDDIAREAADAHQRMFEQFDQEQAARHERMGGRR